MQRSVNGFGSLYKVTRSIILAFFFLLTACSREEDVAQAPPGNFPPEIGSILLTKCATSGCHNSVSMQAAGGLDLSTWEAMFKGTNNGAVTIPFSPEHSPLFFFINTDSMRGLVQAPTMPIGAPPLSNAEVQTMINWILEGAPDHTGFVKFSDDPSRAKFYIANRGCDIVGAHDERSKVVMRYINIGNTALEEQLRRVRTSPDGRYWYATFDGGNLMLKFNTTDDDLAGMVDLGIGNWSDFSISPDGSEAWVLDASLAGRLVHVNLHAMQVIGTLQRPGQFNDPAGMALNPVANAVYVCASGLNSLFKWDVTDPLHPVFSTVAIHDGNGPAANPYALVFNSSYSRYAVLCRGRNEVRIFQATNDSLLAVIQVPDGPAEIVYSPSRQSFYISCEQDNRVVCIDANQPAVIHSIQVGAQPHALALDDVGGLLYVVSRNSESTGPEPHHGSPCGGRNGYLSIINLSAHQLIPGFNMELAVDPISIALRK